MYFNNDHLDYMLQLTFPGARPGTDYVVQAHFAEDGVTLLGNADIIHWHLPTEQPTPELLQNLWDNVYKAKWDQMIQEHIQAEDARRSQIVQNSLLTTILSANT